MCGIDVAFPEWRRRPQLTVQEWINSGRLGAALTRPQREFAELRLGTRSFLDALRDVGGDGRSTITARDCIL